MSQPLVVRMPPEMPHHLPWPCHNPRDFRWRQPCIDLKQNTLDRADFDTDSNFEAAGFKIETDELTYFDEVSGNILPRIHDLLRKAEEINATKPIPPPTVAVAPPAPLKPSVSSRMAKLKFPTFGGDVHDYRRFRDQFKYFTKGLDPDERFYQLTDSMDRPRDRNKEKNCSDIGKAWSILEREYGDQDRLVDTLIADLEKIEAYHVKGNINLVSMSQFVETLQNFSTHFESLGMTADLNGRVMLTQLRRKLPEDHHVSFLEAVRDKKTDNSITGLTEWLHEYLVVLRKAKPPADESQSQAKTQADLQSSKTSKFNKTVNHATVSPGTSDSLVSGYRKTGNASNGPPKCPVHPDNSSHFIQGCNKFRSFSQKEKCDVMNSNAICHRCGHNDCIAGNPPYNYDQCQHYRPCTIPACGKDTHFSSICPRVYGTDGYRHYEMSKPLNPTAQEFKAKTVGLQENSTVISLSPAGKSTSDSHAVTCVLPTVMAYLKHGTKKQLVRILLDSGSQASIIREGIIPLTGNDVMQNFQITTVGGDVINRQLRIAKCEIENLYGTTRRNVRLTEMKKPCGDVPVVLKDQLNDFPYLGHVDLVEASSPVIDILLGVDNGDLLTPDEKITGPNDGDPIAARCPLGWYIQGGSGPDHHPAVNFIGVAATGELEDFIGIDKMGLETAHATESMQRSLTQLEGGAYQISLPWRKPPTDLPNNHDYAVRRFLNLEKQFKKKPREWEIYAKQMDDQLKRGVARIVPQSELDRDIKEGKGMWFLPHFAVLKDSTTTPVRVVYDSKARFQGHSLNDYLAKGDNVNPSIFDVGLRFREYEVGVIADISKMFQAFKLTEDDARYHRYVYRNNQEDPISVYELTTVTFGDKSSPAAAVIALRHIAQEHAPDDSEIQRVIGNQFYVDDLSDSQRPVDSVMNMKTTLKGTLGKGNLDLRKWLSNKRVLCDSEYIPPDGNTTVLGTKWNIESDTLSVKEVVHTEYTPTKRNILRRTASYYDVFGMLSGIIVRPKMLLQKLWQFDLDWDIPINPASDLYINLKAIERDLKDVSEIKIPRCLIPEKYHGRTPLPPVSMHGASDASEDAMGMGVWLRWAESDDSDADITFVSARARLTPLKQSSIPRKELQAILLLCRLMITIRDALRLEIQYMKILTDSVTAIAWLRGQSKSFRSFVACRVGEITTDFDPYQDIAYVPTDQNTIDLVSRGVDVKGMQQVIDGPLYLRSPPSCWPEMPENVRIDRDDCELKTFHIRNAKILALNIVAVEPIVDPTNFSSWTRLIMVTARILSLKDLPKKHWLKQLLTKIAEWPSIQRMKEAELYWIRYAQRDLNFNEHSTMKLNPILDDEQQVYRVGGRIDKAPVSYDMRHPYLLPKKNHISLLITRERHRYGIHGGHIRTVAEVRKTYWIIGDVKLAKNIIRDCKVCIRNRGKALQQFMADLPFCRVRPFTPPFHTTLVDYLGPVAVRLNRNTTTKGYCAVFTCAVVRAVHLTCVQDLTTDAFLQALERFVSIRGAPALMRSDNATCFRGAAKEIRELNLKLDQEKVQSAGLKFDIDWKFGPPDGPHHQGAVERMVQEVKRAMKVVVNAETLTFVEWKTVFSQISSLINCRPITALSSSPLDDAPITPNHFLIGRGDLRSPQIPCESINGNLHKRHQLCNDMVDNFWRRWMSGIQKLSPRHKWSETKENLKEHDVVLVIDDKAKRGSWKMAEVVNVYPGVDDLVRIVDVKFADGHILKRPISRLILLMKAAERTDLV